MKNLATICLVICGLSLQVPAALARSIGYTEDPLKISLGARAMGMGGVYAAVTDGSSNMFNNPAGMYGQQFRAFSMSANLLGDVNYLILGANWPLGPGSMGVGYAGSGVGSLITTSQNGFDYFDYHNDVSFVAYAWDAGAAKCGLRLKYFDEGFTGSTNYVGRGPDLDVGVLYQEIWPKTDLGIVLQNVVPASLGGRINWGNGDTESIPFIGRVGVASRAWRDDVLMALDGDFTLRWNYQSRLHGGLEWKLNQYFRLRAGLDQSYAAGGVSNDLTLGTGIHLGAASFDYAYHPYHNESDALTHYFSLSFSGDDWFGGQRPAPVVSQPVETPPPPPPPPTPVVEAPPVEPPPSPPPADLPKGLTIQTRIFHYFSYGETMPKIARLYYGDEKYARPLARANGLKGLSFKGRKFIYIPPVKELDSLL